MEKEGLDIAILYPLTTAMTHIAIQEALDGKVVEWLEKVDDEQYSSSSVEATRK